MKTPTFVAGQHMMISMSSESSCSIKPVDIKHDGLINPPVNAVGIDELIIKTFSLFFVAKVRNKII